MHKLRTRKQTIAQIHQLGDHMCWASSRFDTEEAQASLQNIFDQSLEHIQEQTAQKKAVFKVEDYQEADLLTRTFTHNRNKETDDNIENIRFCTDGSYE